MQKLFSSLLITLICGGLFATPVCAAPPPPVTATEDAAHIVMDNGIVLLDVSKQKGSIVSVRYRHGGQDTEISKTMYTSASAGPTDRNAPRPPRGSIQTQQNRPPHLAQNTPEAADVQIDSGPNPTFPFHTETHYILHRGDSGFYAYLIYSHTADMPAATIGEARFVIKGLPGTSLFTDHIVDAQRMGRSIPRQAYSRFRTRRFCFRTARFIPSTTIRRSWPTTIRTAWRGTASGCG